MFTHLGRDVLDVEERGQRYAFGWMFHTEQMSRVFGYCEFIHLRIYLLCTSRHQRHHQQQLFVIYGTFNIGNKCREKGDKIFSKSDQTGACKVHCACVLHWSLKCKHHLSTYTNNILNHFSARFQLIKVCLIKILVTGERHSSEYSVQ